MDSGNIVPKGSINTMKFLTFFSCFNCGEVGNYPYLLICNHIYCEKCVSCYNMKASDGSLICPYCYVITKQDEIIPEFDVKLLITDLKSIDDIEFSKKYESKLNFINDINKKNDNKLRNTVLFLTKFISIEEKGKLKNSDKNRKIKRRTYDEFKKDVIQLNNAALSDFRQTFKTKPIFKFK